jgi:hypothetical protein
MSNKAVNWARKVPNLTPTEAFVLWVICDRYNEHVGSAWPSINTIAKDTRYSARTVSRALKTLTDKQVLVRKKTYSDRHSGWVSNTYFLPHLWAERSLLDAEKLEVVWGRENGETGFRDVNPADCY